MEEDQEKPKSLVINSNILFSALVREEGFTRAALLFLKDNTNMKFLVPKVVNDEFKFNVGEIARKSKLDTNTVLMNFKKLLENVDQLNEYDLKTEIEEGLEYVNHDSDAPFVAVALKQKPAYILTYNKKDYKADELKRLGISVVTPKEALELIGIGKLELKTKEKSKKNLLYYLTKMKFFPINK